MIRLFLLILLLTLQLFALSPEQLKVLQTVRDVARTIPDYRGETYENTLAAICLTESSAGKNIIGDFKKGIIITKASLGSMQIQVATARYIAKRIKALTWINTLSDAEIANKLLTDVKTSAQISAYYLTILKKSRKHYFNMISGYNGGMSNNPYYQRVMKNMKFLNKYVKNGKLI
ncbi:transglycosylase SLT domain-containing protein [Sulfurimonas sp. MAG313]|nr:transglycosylase SLT domain-containing protein [Sulfurimonas sp. MAG313]MDF1882182.1 transglycosylase SLT domain-containing protein [Sulfurimonas sp. MAG313]